MSAPTSMPARRARIAEIIATSSISSQGDLRRLLLADGIDVTQATVSRDLEALGAVKRHESDGRVRYEILEPTVSRLAPSLGADALARVAADVLLDAEAALNIAVLHTPPGAAHYLAGFLDRTNVDDLVGTVAGDDTVIVVMRSIDAARDLCDRLLVLAGGGQKPVPAHGRMEHEYRAGAVERRTS
ncbi:MAG: Arginine repressor [Actinomycetota bacterium]|jgi:transcriptional regulator of arginine metabolism